MSLQGTENPQKLLALKVIAEAQAKRGTDFDEELLSTFLEAIQNNKDFNNKTLKMLLNNIVRV